MDIVGNGSAGRTLPNNMNEKIVMCQVKSNPLDRYCRTIIKNERHEVVRSRGVDENANSCENK